jgi:hypothetical protein
MRFVGHCFPLARFIIIPSKAEFIRRLTNIFHASYTLYMSKDKPRTLSHSLNDGSLCIVYHQLCT